MKALTKLTQSVKPAEVEKKWHIIDADGLVVGRLAAIVANILTGVVVVALAAAAAVAIAPETVAHIRARALAATWRSASLAAHCPATSAPATTSANIAQPSAAAKWRSGFRRCHSGSRGAISPMPGAWFKLPSMSGSNIAIHALCGATRERAR